MMHQKPDVQRLHILGEEIQEKVISLGLYKEPGTYETSLDNGKITYGEGSSITGIEKFLGYYDKKNNIAYSPSISITTDFCTVKSFCKYVEESNKDAVCLDDETDKKYTMRAKKALDNFRELTGITGSFQFYLTRTRAYTSAKGLGESAAVASSVARSLIGNVFGAEAAMDRHFVSRCARLVSGSGTRAAIGNTSLWLSYPGLPAEKSYAIELPSEVDKLHIAAFPKKSTIETMSAHDLAVNSPFYEAWLDKKYTRLKNVLDQGWKLDTLCQVAQSDMFDLNSVILASGAFIQTPESIALINAFLGFQKNNANIYMTTDTGPTIVIMSTDKELIEGFKKTVPDFCIDGKIVNNYSLEAKESDRTKAAVYFKSLYRTL